MTGGFNIEKPNYVNFERKFIYEKSINIQGWPEHVPFGDPGHISSISTLQEIEEKVRTGRCKFYKMSPEEWQAERMRIGALPPPAARQRRSDAGKKRSKAVINDSYSTEDEEGEVDRAVGGHSSGDESSAPPKKKKKSSQSAT
jgi:hypothetical protein